MYGLGMPELIILLVMACIIIVPIIIAIIVLIWVHKYKGKEAHNSSEKLQPPPLPKQSETKCLKGGDDGC